MKTGALGLASCLLLASCNWLDSENQPFTEITLQETSCWFDPPASNPATECYFMHVPQDYDEPDDRWIYFPVVVIRQSTSGPGKNPVLHLGGGGPGNPLGFLPGADVDWIWSLYQGMSTDLGRDLVMIEPRGVGYSSPSLSCPEYVDLAEDLLAQNVSPDEENRLTRETYLECRDRLEDAQGSQCRCLSLRNAG